MIELFNVVEAVAGGTTVELDEWFEAKGGTGAEVEAEFEFEFEAEVVFVVDIEADPEVLLPVFVKGGFGGVSWVRLVRLLFIILYIVRKYD